MSACTRFARAQKANAKSESGLGVRQSADAMLVHDRRTRPHEAHADVHHGARQRDGFVDIEPLPGARGDERGELQIRVIAGGDIADDRPHGSVVETFAVDLRT